MKNKSFLDTNVLIYAATGKFSAPAKYEIARRLVDTEDFAVSGQVIGEFVFNVTNRKKMKTPLPSDDLVDWLRLLDHFAFIEIDKLVVQSALVIRERYKIHYWDSALLAQAERFGAEVFYTEDLDHDQMYGSVHARNPFLSD